MKMEEYAAFMREIKNVSKILLRTPNRNRQTDTHGGSSVGGITKSGFEGT